MREVDPKMDPVIHARNTHYLRHTERFLKDDGKTFVPKPFRAEEHSAALGMTLNNEPLARTEIYELQFQDIPIAGPDNRGVDTVDVLSCTTTMEVGIDIGSLTAIALGNVPPGRANYQQRAGRAGRRGSALSIVITFASNDSHDQRFFGEPDKIIRGPIPDPILNLDNRDIIIRHLYGLIFSDFQCHMVPTPDPQDPRQSINVFGSLGMTRDFRVGGEDEFSFRGLRKFLKENRSHVLAKLRQVLPDDLASDQRMIEGVPDGLLSRLEAAGLGPIENPTESGMRTKDEHKKTASSANPFEDDEEDWGDEDYDDEEDGDEEIGSQERPANPGVKDGSTQSKLLDRMFAKGLFPSYAFPRYVAQFHVFENEQTGFRARLRYAPSQEMTIALSTYAPGREVWVDGKRFQSLAIYSPYRDDLKNAWDGRRLYFECQRCGFGKVVSVDEPDHYPGKTMTCDACQARGTLGPGRFWFTPPGFAHPVDVKEDLPLEELPSTDRPTKAKLSMSFADSHMDNVTKDGAVKVIYEKTNLVITNTGSRNPQKSGFQFCPSCGRTEPNGWNLGPLSSGAHRKPFPQYKGNLVCQGRVSREVTLGVENKTDIALFRFRLPGNARLAPGAVVTRIVLSTVAEALALTAVDILGIEAGDVSGEFRVAMTDGGPDGSEVEIFLYDQSSGGAGFSRDAAARAEELLNATLKRLKNCSCDGACYECLCSYANRWIHSDLNRFLGADFLESHLSGAIPNLNPKWSEPLLKQLAEDLKDQGVNVTLKSDHIVLPDMDRTIVPRHPLMAVKDANAKAKKKFGERVVTVDALKIERDLPGASKDVSAMTPPMEGDSGPEFPLPEDPAGLPLLDKDALNRGEARFSTKRYDAPRTADAECLFVLPKGLYDLRRPGTGASTEDEGILMLKPVEFDALPKKPVPCLLLQKSTGGFLATGKPWTFGKVKPVNLVQKDRETQRGLRIRYRTRQESGRPQSVSENELTRIWIVEKLLFPGGTEWIDVEVEES